MGEEYLAQLNEAQRAAVEYLGGPELVIAGAGSGKTRVLTYKILHLLNQGYEPWRILALTFTNKAAREMQSRIAQLVGDDIASRLWMGTFHSIFSRILRRHADLLGFTPNFTVYDTADSKALIRSVIKSLGLPDAYKPGMVASEISNAKNNLISPRQYAADSDISRANAEAGLGEMHTIYSQYCERCRVSDAMDFDDLLFYTNVLMRDNPEVLEKYRQHFRYVLVDEYQDTNFAQHLIVRQLASKGGQICVVGDDAQSIYSFRGANIRNILDLRKTFPNLETFKLERNYRSTGNIVEAANSLIAKNTEQIPKEVYSRNGEGELVEVAQAYDETEEGRLVANAITKVMMRNGDRYSDIAILYRTNAQSRIFEEALRNRNIPYRVYGGLAFYQRKEIKDAVCYFRLAVNPNDDEALRRVVNTPRRGIGETTMAKLTGAASQAGVSLFAVLCDPERYNLDVNRGTRSKLTAFGNQLKEFVGMASDGTDAASLAKYIIERTGLLAQYIQEGDSPENISKRDNILELLKAVELRSEPQEGQAPQSMAEFLAEISLLTDADTQSETDDAVTLMTIHSAKGLEYESVFIVGAEEELLPSGMSLHGSNPAKEIEEERRLMYVALTRAKRFCMISFARQRIHNGQFVRPMPSRFLSEISPRFLKLTAGASLDRRPGLAREPRRPFQAATTPQVRISTPVTTPRLRPLTAGSSSLPAPERTSPKGEGYTRHTSAELAERMKIDHDRFGNGTIIKIDTSGADAGILVDFGGTTRKILLKYASFKIL